MDTIGAVRERYPYFGSVVSVVQNAGTDCLPFFEGGYTHEGGYTLQQNPEEFAALIYLLRERASWRRMPYLEIGSASGGAARLLFEQVGFSHLYSLDNHGHHRWVEQEAHWKSLPITTFVGDSHGDEARAFIASTFPTPTTMVAFIDGDHSYEGATADVALMRPVLGSGSLIIFHDTVACEGVKRTFEETTAWALLIANYIGPGRPLGIGVLQVP